MRGGGSPDTPPYFPQTPIKIKTMKQELKNDLIALWNESEELLTTFAELNDTDLIQCKEAIIERIKNINHWAGKYVTENDLIEVI